jgi:hypothetical protein
MDVIETRNAAFIFSCTLRVGAALHPHSLVYFLGAQADRQIASG